MNKDIMNWRFTKLTNSLSFFRPISLTICSSKLFERLWFSTFNPFNSLKTSL